MSNCTSGFYFEFMISDLRWPLHAAWKSLFASAQLFQLKFFFFKCYASLLQPYSKILETRVRYSHLHTSKPQPQSHMQPFFFFFLSLCILILTCKGIILFSQGPLPALLLCTPFPLTTKTSLLWPFLLLYIIICFISVGLFLLAHTFFKKGSCIEGNNNKKKSQNASCLPSSVKKKKSPPHIHSLVFGLFPCFPL